MSDGGGRYGGAVAADDAQVLELAGREVRITSPDKVLFARARRDEARPRPLLRRGRRAAHARDGRPAGAHAALPAGRGRPVVLPEARAGERAGLAADDDRRRPSTARRRGRSWRPTSRTSRGRSTSPAWASTSGRTAPTTPSTPTSCAWTSTRSRARASPRRARPPGSSRRCSTSSASPASPRRPATAGCTSTSASQPRWDSYAVRSAAVAAARELERRRPDILTAAWWKEERGRRIFVDYNQNAPHKTVFGAWSVRARAGAQVSTPIALGGARRRRPRRADARERARPARARRRPLGRDRRRAAVARAAARAPRARPRERPARRAVAAGLPEAARRAAARRAEPRPPAGAKRGSILPESRCQAHGDRIRQPPGAMRVHGSAIGCAPDPTPEDPRGC